MRLIKCKISLMLNCSAKCVIFAATRAITFETTNLKIYVTVVALLTQKKYKALLEQLKMIEKNLS